jgi:hypothetical protein
MQKATVKSRPRCVTFSSQPSTDFLYKIMAVHFIYSPAKPSKSKICPSTEPSMGRTYNLMDQTAGWPNLLVIFLMLASSHVVPPALSQVCEFSAPADIKLEKSSMITDIT